MIARASGSLVLDVSNNDVADVGAVRASGAVALIAKATEGYTYLDQFYGHHRAVARAARIPFGAYVFMHLDAPDEQAATFLRYAQLRSGDLAPIIDAELPHVFPSRSGTLAIDACARHLETYHYRPILYASASFWLEAIAVRPTLRRLRVWEAQYPGRYTRWFPWLAGRRMRLRHGASVVLWQWTDRFAVGARYYDASRLMAPLDSLLIP